MATTDAIARADGAEPPPGRLPRGAIFDLDGTLCDTAADLLVAANVALRRHGLPQLAMPRDRATAMRGGRSMFRRSLAMARRDGDDPAAERLFEAVYPLLLAAYADAIAVHTRPFAGLDACLDRLEAQGWRLGVCTNKPERLAVRLLETLGLAGRFGAILGADTLAVRKPDPEHLRETARRIGADPRRSVMLGDTATDRDTAAAASVPCVLLVHNLARSPLEALTPEAIADGFAEIPDLLERLVAP
ncbi:MAG: HAD-IA family hydrolase [Pseudomonadota bacterium]